MYMKRSLFSLLLMLPFIVAVAQTNDPVVMNVNGKDVKKSEFEYIYSKNNTEDAIDKRTLDEYVVLFKNFKLRVAEAETQGMDTTAAFHKELNDYRTQLARPYLTVEEIDEDLIKQAYDRSKEYNELTAIFVMFPQFKDGRPAGLTTADTLETYKKALDIRKKALRKGANFEKLVVEFTDEESAKTSSRPGYLGWHSSANLYPSLEAPIVNTPAGGITMPIRTPQGYYVIKINAKKQHPGEVRAAHILIMCPENADAVQVSDAEAKIKEIQDKLSQGVPFAELATEYSEDQGTAARGGDLSWFEFGRMVPEFNNEVFAMTDTGAISKPVKTQYGYHIIKLLDKRESAGYESKKEGLKTKLERTGSYYELYKPAIDKMKQEYSYTVEMPVYTKLYEAALTTIPTEDTYTYHTFGNNEELLFSIRKEPFTVRDFMAFLKENPRSFSNLSSEIFEDKYNQFVFEKLMAAKDASLEAKYPEFRNLMQEYRDGILLFEVSNKEVWDKASTDTTGLSKFFEENKAKYAWKEPHWKGYVVLIKDADTKKKIKKEIKKKSNEEAVAYILENYKVGEVSYVKVEKGLFTKGQNPFVDQEIFKGSKAEYPQEYKESLLLGKLLKNNTPEDYTDVRGLAITDYQNYLETEWLKYLNDKYPVVIYQDVIDTLK
ncbi:peptidyl-prolyl cis-trans isomerase SurA [Dysgonomonadaceae bacterium PH5-43]|nr:peptidyl-prolyl cis-trans isomerase SurA [Dysgonomonadaceae bacterium PH5-43]